MDFDVPPAAIEELLQYFLADAVGLALEGRIEAARDLPPVHRACAADPAGKPQVWAAWQANRSIVSACVLYHPEQPRRMAAHVLFISWWIGSEHHEGWWHCYPRRPREWIKGAGKRDPMISP